MSARARVLFVMNRFRTYDLRMYEVLADAFELRNVWISPPPANEPVPAALAARMRSCIVDENDEIITPRDVRRNAALFRLTAREGRDCDLIIASTSDSWKARVVFAAARVVGVPIAFRKEKWRDRAEAPAGARGLYWRMQLGLTDYLERHAAGVLVGGSKSTEYLLGRGLDREQIAPFRYLHPDLAQTPLRADVVDGLVRQKGARVGFLYLGRIVPRKGLLPLVRAFRRLLASGRDAVLFVVGAAIEADDGRGGVSSAYRDACQRLAADEPRIIFLPPSAPRHVQDYYAAADVFVHPHEAQVDGADVHEGWGNVITEAASMGKAIITTDRVASAFDVVEDGVDGFRIATARLEDGLVEAMAKLVDDRGLAPTLGAAARRRFEEFCDPATNVASLHYLIERGAPQRRRPAPAAP